MTRAGLPTRYRGTGYGYRYGDRGRRPGSGPRRRTVARWGARVTLLLLAAAVAVPLLVASRIWYVAHQDARPPSDAIVVLGAAQYNGDPSEVFTARLEHAAELYHAGVAPRVVTVGSSLPGDNFTEAGTGAEWLAEHGGVPPGRIIAKPRGHDTLWSLRAADRVLERHGWTSAVIVTDPWHSLRSRTIARDLGIGAVTSPARDGNPLVGPTGVEARYIARETLAYLYYMLFHQSTEVKLPV